MRSILGVALTMLLPAVATPRRHELLETRGRYADHIRGALWELQESWGVNIQLQTQLEVRSGYSRGTPGSPSVYRHRACSCERQTACGTEQQLVATDSSSDRHPAVTCSCPIRSSAPHQAALLHAYRLLAWPCPQHAPCLTHTEPYTPCMLHPTLTPEPLLNPTSFPCCFAPLLPPQPTQHAMPLIPRLPAFRMLSSSLRAPSPAAPPQRPPAHPCALSWRDRTAQLHCCCPSGGPAGLGETCCCCCCRTAER